MKQLKESILDPDFDIDINPADPEFINETIFADYVNEAEAVNTEICANIMFQHLRELVGQYRANLQASGVSEIKLLKSGRHYDPAKKPIWLAEELKDYDKSNIDERMSLINFMHRIDEFMDKNIRNWSRTVLCKRSTQYPIMVTSNRVGDFNVEMKLDETPENLELVKKLVEQENENFTIEDGGANKVNIHFILFRPTKKSY